MKFGLSVSRLAAVDFEHLVVGALDEPVEVLAGVIVPVAHHPRVAATAGLFDVLVHDVFLRSPLDAEVLLDLRAHHAEVAGHGDDGVAVLGLFLEHDDLLARLGGRLGGGGAGKAQADDEDFAVLLLLDIGGNWWRRQEIGGVLGGRDAGGRSVSAVAAAARGAALLRRATCEAGHARRSGCRGTEAQERATAQSLVHVNAPSLVCSRGVPSPAVVAAFRWGSRGEYRAAARTLFCAPPAAFALTALAVLALAALTRCRLPRAAAFGSLRHLAPYASPGDGHHTRLRVVLSVLADEGLPEPGSCRWMRRAWARRGVTGGRG